MNQYIFKIINIRKLHIYTKLYFLILVYNFILFSYNYIINQQVPNELTKRKPIDKVWKSQIRICCLCGQKTYDPKTGLKIQSHCHEEKTKVIKYQHPTGRPFWLLLLQKNERTLQIMAAMCRQTGFHVIVKIKVMCWIVLTKTNINK